MLSKKSFFIIIGLSVFLITGIVFAFSTEKYNDQVEDKIIVIPAKVEFKLSPGQIVNQEMTVINRLGRREKVEIVVEGLISQKAILALNKNYSPNAGVSWIKPEISEIYLNHGERVKFNIQIKVPKDIDAGGYYAGVLAVTKGIGKDNDNIKLINRVGTSILMSVPGIVSKDMSILKFSNDRSFYLNGPVNFFTKVVNLGNIHFSPVGEISVYNFLGKKVGQIPLDKALTLPGQSQKWHSTWDEKWILGIYKAHLTMRYGKDEDQVLEREIKFWAFPFHILIIILVIIYLFHKIIQKWQKKYEVRRKLKTQKHN